MEWEKETLALQDAKWFLLPVGFPLQCVVHLVRLSERKPVHTTGCSGSGPVRGGRSSGLSHEPEQHSLGCTDCGTSQSFLGHTGVLAHFLCRRRRGGYLYLCPRGASCCSVLGHARVSCTCLQASSYWEGVAAGTPACSWERAVRSLAYY